MKKFLITLSVCTTVVVEAENYSDAEQKALDDYEKGREALISSIDKNGYEAEYDENLTEDYTEED